MIPFEMVVLDKIMTTYRRKRLRRLLGLSLMSIVFDGEDMSASFLVARDWCLRLTG